MEEFILITKENYKGFFKNSTYGLKIVKYEDEFVRKLLNNRIAIYNEFKTSFTFEERKTSIYKNINEEWVGEEVPDLYDIIYKSTDAVLLINESNYEIEELAIEAKKNKTIVVVDGLEESLFGFAKKIAKKHDIKFTDFGFNGKIKSKSIKKQIEDAYLSGKQNIKFSVEDYNVQTIRNQASTYGSLIGEKIRVKFELGSIILEFSELKKNKDVREVLTEQYKILADTLGIDNAESFVNSLIDSYASKILIKEDHDKSYDEDEF